MLKKRNLPEWRYEKGGTVDAVAGDVEDALVGDDCVLDGGGVVVFVSLSDGSTTRTSLW